MNYPNPQNNPYPTVDPVFNNSIPYQQPQPVYSANQGYTQPEQYSQPQVPTHVQPPATGNYQNFPNQPIQNVPITHTSINQRKRKIVWMDNDRSPSLIPCSQINPLQDAELLQQFLNKHQPDYQGALNILAHRSFLQRDEIKLQYRNRFGKDLLGIVKPLYNNPLPLIVNLLISNGAEQDAYILNAATRIEFSRAAIHIFAVRSSQQIQSIAEFYQRKYGKSLKEKIERSTSGSFRAVLLKWIGCQRRPSGVEWNLVDQHVSRIFQNPFFKFNAPLSLADVLCEFSFEHIRQVNKRFIELHKRSIYRYIKGYCCGNYENFLLSFLQFIDSPYDHFAEFLNRRIIDLDIFSVIILMTTRCEVDLKNIMNTYNLKYGSNVKDDLKKHFLPKVKVQTGDGSSGEEDDIHAHARNATHSNFGSESNFHRNNQFASSNPNFHRDHQFASSNPNFHRDHQFPSSNQNFPSNKKQCPVDRKILKICCHSFQMLMGLK